MNHDIYLHITYEGKTYYLANGAITKEQVYYPYLYSVPSLGIGGDGFARVTTGQVSILRVDNDEYHPFSGSRYYSLLSSAQEIPFEIYYGNVDTPIFTGNLSLSNVTEDELQFLIVEEKFEKELVYPVLDRETSKDIIKYYLFKDKSTKEYRLLFASVGLQFADQDEVILERTYSYASQKDLQDPYLKLDYEDDRDNRYLIADSNVNRFMLVDPEDQSKYLTTADLTDYVRTDKSVLYPDEENILTAMGFTVTLDSDGFPVISDSPIGLSYEYWLQDDDGTNIMLLFNYWHLINLNYGSYTTQNDADAFIYEVPTPPQNLYFVGPPVNNPFAFGEITLRDPVVAFGPRQIKRDFNSYDANATLPNFEPTSAEALITHKANSELFAKVNGQEFIAKRDDAFRTLYRKSSEGIFTFSNIEVYDPMRSTWVANGTVPTGATGTGYNKIRGTVNTSPQGTLYGHSCGSQPTWNNAKWDTLYFLARGSKTTKASWSPAGYTTITLPSTSYWQWSLSTDTTPTGQGQAFSLQNQWHVVVQPWTNSGYVTVSKNGVTFTKTFSSCAAAYLATTVTHNGVNYYRETEQTAFTSASNIYIGGANDYQVRIEEHLSWHHRHYYDLHPNTIGYLDSRSSSERNNLVFTVALVRDNEVPVIEFTRSSTPFKTEVISGINNYWYKITAVKYVGLNRRFTCYYDGPVTYGDTKLYYNGSLAATKTNTNPSDSVVESVNTTNEGTVTYTKGASMGTNKWYVSKRYLKAAGWAKDGTTGNIETKINSSCNISYSKSGSTMEITFSTSDYHWMDATDRVYLMRIAKYWMEPYQDQYQWAHPGQPYIADTEPYYLDNSREKIYRVSIDGQDGYPEGKNDPGFGKGWSKDRSFVPDSSVTDTYGYHISQVYSEGSSIYESENKALITRATGSSWVSDTENLPQYINFNTITKSTAVPSDASVRSDLFRIYRSDNIALLRDLAVVRVPQNSSDKPVTKNLLSATYTETDGTKTTTWNENTFDLENLKLEYDSQLSSAQIFVDCYAGTIVYQMICYDSAGTVISQNYFPDGTVANQKSYIAQRSLPIGTQKISFTIRNDHDNVDEKSKQIRGMDVFVYQRVYPTLNQYSSDEDSYAIAACVEFFEHTGKSLKWANVHDFMDLFTGSSNVDGVDLFDPATGERHVYSINNPHLNVGLIKDTNGTVIGWEPRVFDDGVELGVYLDQEAGSPTEGQWVKAQNTQVLTSASDSSFINLSVNPFGQIGISGTSIHGKNLQQFYEFIAREMNEENSLFLLPSDLSGSGVDFTLAPNSNQLEIPIYQDGQITVVEMAENVAKATNYQFYFRYIIDDSRSIRRQLVVVDLNYVFNNSLPSKRIDSHQLISMQVEFPYPIKAFESTFSRNVAYRGELSQSNTSVMKSISSKFRIAGSGVGNVKSYELFIDSFQDGKDWLNRFAETDILPKTTMEYNDIDTDISLGSKISFMDQYRKVSGFLIVQEIEYNFEQASTRVKGISKFEEIVYS